MFFLSCKLRTLPSAAKQFFFSKKMCNARNGVILGIETSCDDTGCAIVDTGGNILGEALKSQHLVHLK